MDNSGCGRDLCRRASDVVHVLSIQKLIIVSYIKFSWKQTILFQSWEVLSKKSSVMPLKIVYTNCLLLIQLFLKLYTVITHFSHISAVSVSDRFVTDKSSSWFSYHHSCGIELWTMIMVKTSWNEQYLWCGSSLLVVCRSGIWLEKFASFNHVYTTVPVRLLMASRCASLCHAFWLIFCVVEL